MHFSLYQSDELSLFQLFFYSSFLCCAVTPVSQVSGRVGIPLICVTRPHSVCMCLSHVRILKFKGCVTYLCFIFFYTLIRRLFDFFGLSTFLWKDLLILFRYFVFLVFFLFPPVFRGLFRCRLDFYTYNIEQLLRL